MRRRNGRSRDTAWRRYRLVRGLHLIYVPVKRCAFCSARTHVPGPDGWWWQAAETAKLKTPVRISCCPSCYRSHSQAGREQQGALADPEPVIQHGLSVRPRWCPKCEKLLVQEPAYSRCRWGCGKLWPIRGASLRQQLEFERRSGLLLIA